LALLLSSGGCGTLLHPDRQGQPIGKRLDPAVLVLDGALLVFYVVPGLVAYGIDLYTRSIYLPGEDGQVRRVPITGDLDDEDALAAQIEAEGLPADHPNAQVVRLSGDTDLAAVVARANP
jgi:hypothetical protein